MHSEIQSLHAFMLRLLTTTAQSRVCEEMISDGLTPCKKLLDVISGNIFKWTIVKPALRE